MPGSATRRNGTRTARVKPTTPVHNARDTIAINPLKTKIRDLTRLLERSDKLPADVRIEKERALAGYKHDLEDAVQHKRRQAMISKYHMVRFFERQKARRQLKKLKSKMGEKTRSESDGNVVHQAEVDLNYTIYHPLDEKYIALFRSRKEDTAGIELKSDQRTAKETQKKPPMWHLVEQCMEDGNLDLLRDGKLRNRYAKAHVSPADVARANGHKKSNPHQHKAGKGEEEDDDSDGAFFEDD